MPNGNKYDEKFDDGDAWRGKSWVALHHIWVFFPFFLSLFINYFHRKLYVFTDVVYSWKKPHCVCFFYFFFRQMTKAKKMLDSVILGLVQTRTTNNNDDRPWFFLHFLIFFWQHKGTFVTTFPPFFSSLLFLFCE